MSYVTSRQMLLKAQSGGYAVGAFNAENMEMLQAIVAAAEEARSPVMIQTTASTLKYASPALFAVQARLLAEAAGVPVCLHLDHGASLAQAEECLRAGYSSVMIDGSRLPFEDNVTLTSQVVQTAKAKRIPVEAELGKVGGKEDEAESEVGYTDPAEAKEFIRRTGADSLAVAIGTAHGIYKGTPKLDIGRLKEIRARLDVPLVLHGASGLQDAVVRECIAYGVCKVNYATELRIAFTEGVRRCLSENPGAFDPKLYGKAGRDRVQRVVLEKMAVCGCADKV